MITLYRSYPKRRYLAYRIPILFALIVPALLGQTAQITGLLTDQSGASVPGAIVAAQNLDTGIKLTTTSNESGNYTIPGLPVGSYSVTATKEGFKTLVRSPVKLDVAQNARIDFSLDVGSVSERLTVEASAPILQTEESSVGQVINKAEVVSLPLNGRDFLQLASLTPGTVQTGAGYFLPGNAIRVNGSWGSTTVYMVDGINSTDSYFPGAIMLPSPDAIQEFKVQSNTLDARYGIGASVVNVDIRSGTNQFHGNLFEFLRNDAMDARNFFAITNPPLKQNQFGGTFGGPIVRNRTFFFVDYQGTRIRRGQTFNSIVPTSAMWTGNFAGRRTITDPFTGIAFPNNQIPANRIASQAAFFQQYFPLPNAGTTFIASPAQSDDTDQYDIRGDHQFSLKDSMKGSYSEQREDTYLPGSFPLNGGEARGVRAHRAGVGWVHTFSPSLVNEFTGGYTRLVYTGVPQGLGTNYTQQAGIGGFNQTSAEFPGFPGITLAGYTGLNGNVSRPTRDRENQWVLSDNLTLVRGTHTIQAGFDVRSFKNDNINAANARGSFVFSGTYTGDAFADYLLGYPFQASRDYPRDLFGYTDRQQGFYVQDNWKVRPNLTLNLGLRYALLHPMDPIHDQVASVNISKNQIVVGSDSSGKLGGGQQVTPVLLQQFASMIVPSSQVGLGPSLRKTYYDYLDPRLGLAWELKPGLVLRMGYAIVHVIENGERNASAGIINPPFIADEVNIPNTTPVPTRTFGNYFPPISAQNPYGPLAFFSIDPNRPFAYLQQYNVTLQKSLSQRAYFEAAYVGSKGTHFPFSALANIPLPGPGPIQARRPNPLFAAGNLITNTDNNSYNSLQTKFEVKTYRGINLIASYTWSKALDYQPQANPTNPREIVTTNQQNPNNAYGERGLDPTNIAHRFTAGLVYESSFFKGRQDAFGWILKDWGFTTIVTAQTGFPFTPTIGTDPANTGTSLRPNRIGNGASSDPTLNQWFNVAAFSVPGAYTYGNSGLNILTGPGLKDWDFGSFRHFPLFREGAGLEFRAEFFNITNTPSFGNPVTNIQSTSAGKILATSNNPREIQLSLKFRF